MDTLKIRAILSAVKQKSLSKAAEEISYTPSALSHMADSLEVELGVRLLKRTPFGVELTEEGKTLYDELTAVIKAEDELFQKARTLQEQKAQELRIGTYSSISQHILPELLHDFKRVYPEVKVSISVGDRLRKWLDEDIADVLFTDENSVENNVWLPLKEEPFVAIVPANAFKSKKSVEHEELYAHSYISTNETKVHRYFDESKFRSVLHFDSVDDMSVLSMVKEEIGIAILPSLVVKKPYKGVRALKLNPEITRTIGVVYKKNPPPDSATGKFIDFLLNRKLDSIK